MDLYYRIVVLTVTLPPLRERSEDVPLPVETLLGDAAAATGRERLRLTPDVLDRLVARA